MNVKLALVPMQERTGRDGEEWPKYIRLNLQFCKLLGHDKLTSFEVVWTTFLVLNLFIVCSSNDVQTSEKGKDALNTEHSINNCALGKVKEATYLKSSFQLELINEYSLKATKYFYDKKWTICRCKRMQIVGHFS